MATKGMAYDHPNFTIRRERSVLTTAGNGTGTEAFMSFQKTRLITAYIKVQTAGTSAGHNIQFQNNGVSFATVTLGTNTANYTTSVSLNQSIDPYDHWRTVNGTDATGRAYITWEYETLPTAVVTD